MPKLYTCTLTNKQFHSLEELTEHLLTRFAVIEEREDDIERMRQTFLDAFPESEIAIAKKDSTEQYTIKVDGLPYELSVDATILPLIEPGNHQDMSFPSIGTLIGFLQENIRRGERFVERILKEFPQADNVCIQRMHVYPYLPRLGADIQVMAKGHEKYISYSCEPKDSHELERAHDEEYLREVEGLFLQNVSGEVKGHIEDAYDIFIDGICLPDILKRAKRLRIEILEEHMPEDSI